MGPPPPIGPPPPSPPPFTPGTCMETCATAGDGTCQDGGPGSKSSTCAPGTDCTDCKLAASTLWPRPFDECKLGCFAYMMGDGTCDAVCNNYQCGHNDCSVQQAQQKCLGEMPETMAEVSAEASSLGVTASFHPKAMEVHADSVQITGTFMLRYADERLLDTGMNPCRSVLPHMMSITPSDAASQASLLAKLEATAVFALPFPQAVRLTRSNRCHMPCTTVAADGQ